jgi:hypothetical protein
MSDESLRRQLKAMPEPLYDFGDQLELLKRMIVLTIQAAQADGDLEASFERAKKIAARIEKALARERLATNTDLLFAIAILATSTVTLFIQDQPDVAKAIFELKPPKRDKIA